MDIKIGEMRCYIDSELAVEWHRGREDCGIIVLDNDFINKRGLEEVSINDAENFAKAILAICEDARKHDLKPDLSTSANKQNEKSD